jgi:hypothetical protein
MSPFQHDGVWWDPREPGTQWVGTLRFDHRDGAVLTVTVPTDKPSLASLGQYEVLHGLTTERKAVTLLRCFDRLSRGSLGGAPRFVEIFANAVIVGFHCDQPDPLLSSAAASFSHMNEWWGRSGIQADPTVTWPDSAVRYKSAPALVVHDDGCFRVSIRSVASGACGNHRASLVEEVRFEIEASTATPLSRFQRIVQACGDFLSVACLSFCDTMELSLVTPAREGAVENGTFHAVPIYKDRGRRSSSSPFMLFRFRDVEQRAAEVLGAWLSQSERLYEVRALYLAGVYGGGFIEGKLLALTQAAEAFHRRFCSGLYMDEAMFEKEVLEPLKAAIPPSVHSDLREAIAARLRFANAYSQRRRLRALFAEHTEVLRVLVDEPEKYISPIVDLRNEFTHFPPDSDTPDGGSSPDPERVLLYNWILRLLLESCLLKVVGFSLEDIRALVERSATYRQVSARWRARGTA